MGPSSLAPPPPFHQSRPPNVDAEDMSAWPDAADAAAAAVGRELDWNLRLVEASIFVLKHSMILKSSE